MENQYGFTQDNYSVRPLPNATLVLVLGVLSLIGVCCYGLMGAVLGIIAIVLAVQDQKAYHQSPERYTLTSYNHLRMGKIFAIIGVSFSLLFLVIVVGILFTVGMNGLNDPERIQEFFESFSMAML